MDPPKHSLSEDPVLIEDPAAARSAGEGASTSGSGLSVTEIIDVVQQIQEVTIEDDASTIRSAVKPFLVTHGLQGVHDHGEEIGCSPTCVPDNSPEEISSLESACSNDYIGGDELGPLTRFATNTTLDSGGLVQGPRRRSSSCFSESTIAIRKLDAILEHELTDEPDGVIIPALTAELFKKAKPSKTPNPYQDWECAFHWDGSIDTLAEIPNTKTEFLTAVKREIAASGYIQQGLVSFTKAIHSGKYHNFTKPFLKYQDQATAITIGQLYRIIHDLQEIVKEVEQIEGATTTVTDEMKDLVAHAQPLIERSRKILVSSHIFYKINYVLSAEKK